MTDLTAAEAAHVRRMVPRIRRMLAGSGEEGLARAVLRRRLNSREKHLYDAALDLLIAVGDVAAVPAASGGTRYVLVDLVRKTTPEPPSRLATTKNAHERSTH